ncbi:MAG: alpha/beta hydrolase [Pseudomonadota bacterium]
MTSSLPNAVDAPLIALNGRAGRLAYYRAGSGPPVLLIHSINAAGSTAEMAPLFEHLRRHRTVFALDLPGFGHSDRSEREYTVTLFVTAIQDIIDVIYEECDTPIDAVALSLSAEFLARAALHERHKLRSLTLITPTGFNVGANRLRAPPGTTRYMPILDKVLRFPLWRKRLFAALVSPRSIRYFLRRTYGSGVIDEKLALYCDATTHQPGADRAPFAFLSGVLFSKDIRTIYEALVLPVFLAHGTRGDFADFRGADWTDERDNWTVSAYDAGALLHFECDEFAAHLDAFFASL